MPKKMVKISFFRRSLSVLVSVLFLAAYVAPDFSFFHNHHDTGFSPISEQGFEGNLNFLPESSSEKNHECALCGWKNQRETPAKAKAIRNFAVVKRAYICKTTSLFVETVSPESFHARAPPA